jgi:hypothetical protein
MPLFSIDEKQVKSLPKARKVQFNRWRQKTSDADYELAVKGIARRCDDREFVVSSFLPGKDWSENEFQPLFLACGRNEEHAGWYFGLIVWQYMIDDPERNWYFLKPGDEDDVKGMRYFTRP